MVEFKADLNYAGENGMIINSGNSLGRGALVKDIKSGNSRQNSGNTVRYVREYPKTEKGYYGTSSKNSGKSSIREIPGGEKEAKRFFESETRGYVNESISANGDIVRYMPDGQRIGFRPLSRSGDAAVDFSAVGPNKPYQKIHFPE